MLGVSSWDCFIVFFKLRKKQKKQRCEPMEAYNAVLNWISLWELPLPPILFETILFCLLNLLGYACAKPIKTSYKNYICMHIWGHKGDSEHGYWRLKSDSSAAENTVTLQRNDWGWVREKTMAKIMVKKLDLREKIQQLLWIDWLTRTCTYTVVKAKLAA